MTSPCDHAQFTGDDGGAGEKKLSAGAVLAAGAIGGVGYWVSSFPFDVVKSRIQTQPTDLAQRQYKYVRSPPPASYALPEAGRFSTDGRNVHHRSTWDAMVQLNKAEGWRGFWRGFTPCMLRACPANAACFFAYETARSLLG